MDEERAQWQALAGFAERLPVFLGHCLGGVETIQAALGCTYEQAVHTAFWFTPWPGADLDLWGQAVADFVRLTPEQAEKLVALVRGKEVGR